MLQSKSQIFWKLKNALKINKWMAFQVLLKVLPTISTFELENNNHIWIHSIVHVKKNIYLFNCYDVSFLELLWYYAKLTLPTLHTYFLVTMSQIFWTSEKAQILLKKWSEFSLSDILGDIRTKILKLIFEQNLIPIY